MNGVPVLVWVLALGSVGCDRVLPIPAPPEKYSAPAPGGDELYLSGEFRLSLTAFEGLRIEYPGLTTTHTAMLALATQWLAARTAARATPEMIAAGELKDAAQCVRLLFFPALPQEKYRAALANLERRYGFSSVDELRREWVHAYSRRVIIWNPTLVREYAIDVMAFGGNSG